ncbi:serine threonine kinase [Tubulinosema ratisbonensis]|uniref:Serine threonine kinase n=1 Tax=Tubulinosema ratisbonensis TaxID=291195 RepID=A0A437ALH1_9MICR|nr:serine threonine kinase [Tubulinosema ratisbonensis]
MYIKPKTKINSYEFITVLGEGRYSVVYKVKGPNEEILAIKAISKNTNLFSHKYAENEMKIVKYLKPHKNLVTQLEQFEDDEGYYFVMEYIDGYSIKREVTELIWRDSQSELSLEMKKSIILQTIEGLKFLHKINIYHCDIKPDNIVLEGDSIKIVDFGCSFHSESKFVTFSKGVINSTPGVGPPEIIFTDPEVEVDLEKVDVWGVGYLIYYIFSGVVPFVSRNASETYLEVKNLKINYNPLPKNVTQICKSIFTNNLKLRLTLSELEELIIRLEDDN